METIPQTNESPNQAPMVLASRPKRLVGAVIDSLVLLAVLYPILHFTGLLTAAQGGTVLSVRDRVVLTLLVWALFTLIHGHLLTRHGQTVGKRLVGSRIVDPRGHIMPMERVIVLRYFLFGLIGHIPYVGIFVQFLDAGFIFRPDRRCLHDHVAGTIVIEVGPAPLWPWPTATPSNGDFQ